MQRNLALLHENKKKRRTPLVGIEPTAFELEVQRAIHCATGAYHNLEIIPLNDTIINSTSCVQLNTIIIALIYSDDFGGISFHA